MKLNSGRFPSVSSLRMPASALGSAPTCCPKRPFRLQSIAGSVSQDKGEEGNNSRAKHARTGEHWSLRSSPDPPVPNPTPTSTIIVPPPLLPMTTCLKNLSLALMTIGNFEMYERKIKNVRKDKMKTWIQTLGLPTGSSRVHRL